MELASEAELHAVSKVDLHTITKTGILEHTSLMLMIQPGESQAN